MLQFDPQEAVAHLSARDRALARMIQRVGPFALQPEKIPNSFLTLLKAIVHQQLSVKAGATIYARVTALLPRRQTEMPQAILDLADEQLRGAGMSRAKVSFVKDLAAKTLDGTVPSQARLRKMADADVINTLTQVHGIGQWTAQMLLIFKLGRGDVLPLADLGLRSGYRLTFKTDEMPLASEIEKRGERWRPFRSVASWYLWRAVDLAKKKE